MEFTEEPKLYNGKVNSALRSLEEHLPTFALMDKGISDNENLCLLIERGNFWGMGYVSSEMQHSSLQQIKERIEPYADNDFIRNSIYSYAERNPEKKVLFSA